MSAQFTISAPEEKDIGVLGGLLLRSKLSLSINRLLWKNWPNETAQRERYTAAVAERKEGQPEVNDKAQPEAEAEGAANRNPPAEMDADVLAGVGKACQEVASGLDFPENYDLVFIVVDQLHRGKGVGSQLLQRGFAEARAAGIPFCVVSEPAARCFFDKSGFKEVVHADMDLSVWAPPYSGFGVFRLTGMVWRPE